MTGAPQTVLRQVEFLAIGAGAGAALAIICADGAGGWSLALGTGCFLALVVVFAGFQVLQACRADKSMLVQAAVQSRPTDARHAQDMEALAQDVRSTTAEAALGAEVAWQLVSGIATVSAILQSARLERSPASHADDPAPDKALVSTMNAAISQAVEELSQLARLANAAATRKAA